MRDEDYVLSDFEIEEFDKLFDGNISEEYYYIIMAKLKLDEVLQHKYLVYKLLRNEIEQDGIANKILKQRFIALDQNLRKKKFHIFTLISSILLVVIIAFLFNFKSKNIKVYEKYKDSESGISIKMNNLKIGGLDAVMIEIAKGEYDQAHLYLSQLPTSDTTLYYQAYCNERLGKYNEAANIYRILFKSNAINIRHKSTFRLALIKLRSGDESAYQELNTIAEDAENTYNRTAQEILESIR